MTMGDFIQTAFCYPIEAIARILDNRHELPMFLNVTVHFLTWVTLSGSSLSLILLNLDKLLYFKYPLRYSAYVTKRRGIVLALIVWACCVIFVAGAWYFECFKCEDNCSTIQLLHERWGMYVLFSVSVCVMPTLTSLAVALYIVKVVSSHRKKLAEEYLLGKRYSAYVTKRRGIVLALIVWACCVIFVAGAWYFECFKCEDNCSTIQLLHERWGMYVLFSVSVCVMPTLTSLAVALYIVKVVSSHRKKLAEEQALYQTGPARQALVSRLRTFYFVFMTTVFTAATLLPFRISSIIMSFSEHHELGSCSGTLSRWIMAYLISLNAIFNPLITVTVLPQYRCRLVGRLLGTYGTETKTADL
ncbi:hypothetical protein OESDEN_11570 [Oesophagostomum dentatum]|uniref:G-protein coupled receptors family 1 profile domain-containing protein n=1 Tax=Oesophagostomum dentatum TaxID=61180 RepID=A0A0B1SUP5_OESDE|nr:hypothetical protein OESDEN_11570 [Oesophagostomum dentatum]